MKAPEVIFHVGMFTLMGCALAAVWLIAFLAPSPMRWIALAGALGCSFVFTAMVWETWRDRNKWPWK